MNGNKSVTANFSAAAVSQTITTAPAGLTLTVDGASCTTPCVRQWTAGTVHTVSAAVTQSGSGGAQYAFTNWSDGGALSHSVTASVYAPVWTATYAAAPSGSDFSIATSASRQTVAPGGSSNNVVLVSAFGGFGQNVELSTSVLPAGLTASFSPATVNGAGTPTLTFTATASTPRGRYGVFIQGQSGSVIHTAALSLCVDPQGCPSGTVTVSPVAVDEGDSRWSRRIRVEYSSAANPADYRPRIQVDIGSTACSAEFFVIGVDQSNTPQYGFSLYSDSVPDAKVETWAGETQARTYLNLGEGGALHNSNCSLIAASAAVNATPCNSALCVEFPMMFFGQFADLGQLSVKARIREESPAVTGWAEVDGPSITVTTSGVGQSAEIHLNLGPIPLDKYTSRNDSKPPEDAGLFFPGCPATFTVQDCVRRLFVNNPADRVYSPANYTRQGGIQGVRFFYGLGGYYSTPFTSTGCPSGASVCVSSEWLTNLKEFFRDLRDNGVHQVSPTWAPDGWGDREYFYSTTTAPEKDYYLKFQKWVPYGYIDNPALKKECLATDGTGECTRWSEYSCYEQAWPIPRPPEVSTGASACQPGRETKAAEPVACLRTPPWDGECHDSAIEYSGHNDSYNKAEANPYFGGWDALLYNPELDRSKPAGLLYEVIKAVRDVDRESPGAPGSNLRISDIDLLNEMNLKRSTVQGRWIVDQKNESDPRSVFDEVSALLEGFQPGDGGRVGYSAATSNPIAPLSTENNCNSVYGTAATLMNVAQVRAALTGSDKIGMPTGYDSDGGNLICGGSSDGMFSMPYKPGFQRSVSMTNIHTKLCIDRKNGACDPRTRTTPPTPPDPPDPPRVNRETAKQVFNDIAGMTAGLSVLIFGETLASYCESYPVSGPEPRERPGLVGDSGARDNLDGFVLSNLSSFSGTKILRLWLDLNQSCYPMPHNLGINNPIRDWHEQ
jgi:hypothetical protein